MPTKKSDTFDVAMVKCFDTCHATLHAVAKMHTQPATPTRKQGGRKHCTEIIPSISSASLIMTLKQTRHPHIVLQF